MGISEIISIVTGIVSVLLGVYAVYQSKRYKKIGDRLDRDRDQIIKAIYDNSIYSSVEIRHLSETTSAPLNMLNLHKDKLYVYRTSKYKSCNASEVIDKLNKELPNILKQTYIDSIMASLNLENEDTEKVGVVTLRHQYEKEDLDKIIKLNDIFGEDGILFEFSMR